MVLVVAAAAVDGLGYWVLLGVVGVLCRRASSLSLSVGLWAAWRERRRSPALCALLLAAASAVCGVCDAMPETTG